MVTFGDGGNSLSLEVKVRPFIKHRGNNVCFLQDYWHPDGVLSPRYLHRIIYDAAGSVNAKFSSVL